MVNYALFIPIILLDLILGFIVYFKNRNNTTNITFFWMTFFSVVWIFSNFFENELALENYRSLLLQIDFASAAILAYFFVYFCLNFPINIKIHWIEKFFIALFPIICFILSFSSLIIKDISFDGDAIQFQRGILYWLYGSMIIVYIAVGSFNLIFKIHKLINIERVQTIYVVSGLTLSAFIAIPINLVLTQIIEVPVWVNRIGIYGFLFFILLTAYAIIKHHLMEIKVITTEILSGLAIITLFVDLFFSESTLITVFKSIVFIIFFFLGIYLVKSVLKEVKQREQIEELAVEVNRAYEVEKIANEELRRLDEARTQFLMATQHHLRTPLTSMRGYVELILDGTYGKCPQKIRETILKFKNSTEREIKVVNEFLDVSQFQLGKEVVKVQKGVSLDPIFREIMEELRFEADVKKLYLKIDNFEKELPLISADPEKLKVALYNLVDNAIKYTRQGGVTIGVRAANKNVRIAVKDTGMGISKEDLPILFTRIFERGDEAKKVHGTGKGIGLYITSEIIKAHKGKIWAESEGIGRGTTFFIELPV